MSQSPFDTKGALEPAKVNDHKQSLISDAPASFPDAAETSVLADTADDTARAGSPSSKKRAISESVDDEEPSSKKGKASSPASSSSEEADELSRERFPSPPGHPATNNDKEKWQGFCEIESEPAYFSVILREIGVQDVTVREVFALTPDLLEMLPQPVYGLILLFRYRAFGKTEQTAQGSNNVWFANQLPGQNSCGTLAMTNIIMNTPEVDVGEHLIQFKDFTKDLTPFQRGEAFASFDFVKRIHNSFAKKMDILENDTYLKYKVKRARYAKKKEEKAEKEAQRLVAEQVEGGEKEKEEAQPLEEDQDKLENEPSNSKSRGRRRSADSIASDDSAENYENNAHHFIAFVPVGNEVWKLDGMDAQPTSICTFAPESGETWLEGASDTIAALMASGDNDYSVLALSQSPVAPLRKKACLTVNTLAHVDSRLDTISTSWKEFLIQSDEPPSPRMLGLEAHLPRFPMPEATRLKIDGETLPDLLLRRGDLVADLNKTAADIMEEMEREAAENDKATFRRFDAGPVIQMWLQMLAENGYLEANLHRFMK